MIAVFVRRMVVPGPERYAIETKERQKRSGEKWKLLGDAERTKSFGEAVRMR